MRKPGRWILFGVLLLVAACGTPTGTSRGGTGQSGANTEVATPAATDADTEAGIPAAAGGGTEAATAEPAPATTSEAGAAGGQSGSRKQYSAEPEMQIDPAKQYTAVIETSKGTMRAELYPEDAPRAVNSFVFLAREGFFDGIRVHRIVKGFMIQTGDPTGTGMGGPDYQFPDEPVTREYVRGTLAMANSGPDTNRSQFFIMHGDAPGLPKDYTIFGKLTEGFEALDAIADTPVGFNPDMRENSAPQEEVTITRITIEDR